MGICGCLTFLIAVIAALLGVAFVNKEKLFQPAVEFAFDSYEYGVLCIEYEDGRLKYFGKNKPKSMNPNQKVLNPSICDASIKINNDSEFFRILATGGGSIGLGEAYIEGVWETRDKYKYTPEDTTPLSKFVYHLLFNVWAQKSNPLTLRYWAQWGMTIGQFREWLVRKFETNKSEKEDLRDIEYHYDIGNDFFEGYLGPTLSGSCAIWTGGKEQTLEEAQNNKWSTIIKKIGIRKEHHVLDVGCGWGYFC